MLSNWLTCLLSFNSLSGRWWACALKLIDFNDNSDDLIASLFKRHDRNFMLHSCKSKLVRRSKDSFWSSLMVSGLQTCGAVSSSRAPTLLCNICVPELGAVTLLTSRMGRRCCATCCCCCGHVFCHAKFAASDRLIDRQNISPRSIRLPLTYLIIFTLLEFICENRHFLMSNTDDKSPFNRATT